MPTDKKFDLGDYVEVKDRIARFYELYGQGRLVTGEVRLTNEPDGVPRVMVQGLAYRTPDDPLPGVGWSWMVLPGTTSYTKGSELENVETSAWGRAIGSLGILILSGLASRQEVQNKQGETERPTVSETIDDASEGEQIDYLGNLQKSGTVMKGGAASYTAEYHETPHGHYIGFRLKLADDKDIPQVLIRSNIGEPLYLAGVELLGQHVTVKGRLYNIRPKGRGAFYRLVVGEAVADFIETPDVRIPPLSVADVSPDEAAEILRLELAEATA